LGVEIEISIEITSRPIETPRLTNFLFQVPAAVEVDKLVKEATKACYDDYLAKIPNVN
jgi:hypothetical protein